MNEYFKIAMGCIGIPIILCALFIALIGETIITIAKCVAVVAEWFAGFCK